MNRQWTAVEAISRAAREDEAVRAVFLKGSLALGLDDEHADVDIYCLVEQGELASFLERRLDILQSYADILYHSESNFVGPQVVAVFTDGLHVDLYAVTPDNFPPVGAIRSLWDPDSRLPALAAGMKDHSLNWQAIHGHFSEFSFTLLEFGAAWRRNDVLWSARLASHLAGDLGVVLRSLYDPANGQLGTKRLEGRLPPQVREQMRLAVSSIGGSETLATVLSLCRIMRSALATLEEKWQEQADWSLFDYMEKELMRAL